MQALIAVYHWLYHAERIPRTDICNKHGLSYGHTVATYKTCTDTTRPTRRLFPAPLGWLHSTVTYLQQERSLFTSMCL
jgi:hypothetical protein